MTDANAGWGAPPMDLAVNTGETAWPTAEAPAEHVAVEESQEAFIRRRDDELQQWLELKASLTTVKDQEAEARAAVTQTLFPTPTKGTQRYPLNGGYAVKLVHGWTYTLGDKDKLGDDGLKVSVESQVVALEERIKALGPEGELIVRRAIRWKPELVPAEYEKLGAAEATATENQAFDLITEILTIKPASLQLTFEEPKAPK